MNPDEYNAEAEEIGAASDARTLEILERARKNDDAIAFAGALLDTVLYLGGAALSSQVPGAAFAVEPVKAITKRLIDDAIVRRLGRV